ncbi:MAG: glycosyltransferase family 4 protein [Chlamydiales bacterium]
MRLLHIEASPGWGGQELRILRESEGMRARGHQVILAVQKGGGLVQPAREAGFQVYEIPFRKSNSVSILFQLLRMIRKLSIEVVNTHSSLDAWLGGLAGKISGCRVVRTRHLSTPVRKGLNSYLLYNWLADHVVTTCEEAKDVIQMQARLPDNRCCSIPTGVDTEKLSYNPEEVKRFREKLGISPGDCLAGTLCVLRGWKGVNDLLHAAYLLKEVKDLKWLVVGSGVSENYFISQHRKLGLQDHVYFTGHLSPPYTALAAMDIFLLLSWAHEGVSQASLQAAWFKKPLVTTSIGGLKEICIENQTGFQVPAKDPKAVAQAVRRLMHLPELCQKFGNRAKALVKDRFTLTYTLDQMEHVYCSKGVQG